MFRIHRLFIKTAIAYLVLGVGLGGWLLLQKAVSGAGGSHDLALVQVAGVLLFVRGIWGRVRPPSMIPDL